MPGRNIHSNHVRISLLGSNVIISKLPVVDPNDDSSSTESPVVMVKIRHRLTLWETSIRQHQFGEKQDAGNMC